MSGKEIRQQLLEFCVTETVDPHELYLYDSVQLDNLMAALVEAEPTNMALKNYLDAHQWNSDCKSLAWNWA